jgi:hypothetical protein
VLELEACAVELEKQGRELETRHTEAERAFTWEKQVSLALGSVFDFLEWD